MKRIRLAFALLALCFAVCAVWQIPKRLRLPNAVVYCVCAWLLVQTRKAL